jgi:hypothetical protein
MKKSLVEGEKDKIFIFPELSLNKTFLRFY